MRGLKLTVIGDTGPFSLLGKSICYKLEYEGEKFLIDCGAPLFELLGSDELMEIRGVFCTHSHDDHKRTFTDLALFYMYEGRGKMRLPLVTSETVHEEFHKSSKAALERSLSADSKRIVDVPYSDLVEPIRIGPRARYRIAYLEGQQGGGIYRVIDRDGNVVEPTKAKVFIGPRSNIPRMLYRDAGTGEWVEPATYYSFECTAFYEDDQNVFEGADGRLRIRAVNAHSWHGVPAIGFEVTTAEGEKLVITSDTVYDPDLWRALASEKREQKLSMSHAEFVDSYIIRDDINNYIERTWGDDRLRHALDLYRDAVMLHDVAAPGSVVHTDYPLLAASPIKSLILTHAPDDFVSVRALSRPGKVYRIIGDTFYEELNGMLYPENADIYVKQRGNSYVGYRNPEGIHAVVTDKAGMLSIERATAGHEFRIDLYRVIEGRFYRISDDRSHEYRERPDGWVELVTFNETGSTGVIAMDERDRLSPPLVSNI